jgi:hypothetical protein
MINEPKNKMIHSEDVKNKSISVEEEYFFPEYQITIAAKSREDAEKQLQDLLNKK